MRPKLLGWCSYNARNLRGVRRSLWVAAALAVVVVGGFAAFLEAGDGRGPALQLGGPVNPAPGAHARVVWPAGRPLRVLFVGDSLTVGYYASRRNTAFPALVTAALRAHAPVREAVRARSGVTASYWAVRPLPSADLVVLELGTNDYRKEPTPHATFERDYRRLIANVRARSPHARLLCVSLWRTSHYRYGGATLLSYNRIVARNCRGGAFVWISELYDTEAARDPAGLPSFLGRTDGFHPNDTGHRAIAKAIEQTLGL
jgi:acyl-CoA thioesterase-1